MTWRVNQRWPVTVVVAAVAISFTGFAAAQVPNPLPLQNQPAPPQRINVVSNSATGVMETAVCPSGFQLVGGGGFGPGGLLVSEPQFGSSRTTWFVESITGDARATAICERP